MKNIDDKNGGIYRSINVTISGANHVPPDFFQVQAQMSEFIEWYMTKGRDCHPMERAARVHADFVKIHPFVDGNGRISRLLMNLELMKDGFPPVVLPVENRLDYYKALDEAHTTGNYNSFFVLIIDIAVKGFKPYWHALGVI